MKRIITLAAAAVLLLAGCATPAPAPAQQPDPPVVAVTTAAATTKAHVVGESVELKGKASTSNVTITSATYSTEPLNKWDSGPRKGGYLILEVLWETVEGTADVNPLLFNAKDATGLQQGPQLGMTGGEGLAAADVPAGDKLRGKVVMDIGPGPWVVTAGAFTEAARWNITG